MGPAALILIGALSSAEAAEGAAALREPASAGPLTKPDSPSPKKKKKKKKKKKPASSEAAAEDSDSTRTVYVIEPAWGRKATVLVGLSGGLTEGSLFESARKGGSCDRALRDCAVSWGPHASAMLAFPGMTKRTSPIAPTITYTRHSFSLHGDRQGDAAAAEDGSGGDSPPGAMELNELRFGFLILGKTSRKSPWGGSFHVDLGYAAGSASSTVLPAAPGEEATDRLRGPVGHFGGGLTYHPSKHVHLGLTSSFSWMRLPPAEPVLRRVGSEPRARFFTFSPSLDAMVTF